MVPNQLLGVPLGPGEGAAATLTDGTMIGWRASVSMVRPPAATVDVGCACEAGGSEGEAGEEDERHGDRKERRHLPLALSRLASDMAALYVACAWGCVCWWWMRR